MNVNNALAAYANAANQTGGVATPAATTGASFADMLTDASNDLIDTGKKSEAVTAQAAVGTADLNDVIAAISNFEVSLQSAVAVRDKVVQAYQEVMRMSI